MPARVSRLLLVTSSFGIMWPSITRRDCYSSYVLNQRQGLDTSLIQTNIYVYNHLISSSTIDTNFDMNDAAQPVKLCACRFFPGTLCLLRPAGLA